jgi:hypothetical protein
MEAEPPTIDHRSGIDAIARRHGGSKANKNPMVSSVVGHGTPNVGV